MPVPLPAAPMLTPPDAEESAFIVGGIVSAVAPAGELTDLQAVLIEAVAQSLTGFTVDPRAAPPIDAAAFARGLADRNAIFRTRIVQVMLLPALVLRPLPEDVVARVTAFATELCVDDGMLAVAHRFADGALGLAAFDFDRNGYTADWTPARAAFLHTSGALAGAWDQCVHDEALAARWDALGDCAPGTLGRGLWEFYRARGFVFPGRPGSAPPLLAQHDWVHVLADYGTTLANLRRGALCRTAESTSIDFLAVDWFTIADLAVAEAQAYFGLVPKSDRALDAGSVGPWAAGGISEYQWNAGHRLAAEASRPYESYGACVA